MRYLVLMLLLAYLTACCIVPIRPPLAHPPMPVPYPRVVPVWRTM